MIEENSPTLAELMKAHEHSYRRVLDPRSYVLLRLDGRSFHAYTKKLAKPFDLSLMAAMDQTMVELCQSIQGVRFGYVESDEISLLIAPRSVTPPSDSNPSEISMSELWMGGVEAKIISLSAAIATAKFNAVRIEQAKNEALNSNPSGPEFSMKDFHRGPALFDSRVWAFEGTENGRDLVRKYFLWRRRDSIKNSVTMAALSKFSSRQIHGLKTKNKIELLKETDAAWDNLPAGFRFGRFSRKVKTEEPVSYIDKRTGNAETTIANRAKWVIEPLTDFDSVFTEDTLPKAP